MDRAATEDTHEGDKEPTLAAEEDTHEDDKEPTHGEHSLDATSPRTGSDRMGPPTPTTNNMNTVAPQNKDTSGETGPYSSAAFSDQQGGLPELPSRC